MQIKQFQSSVLSLLQGRNDDLPFWVSDKLEIFIQEDGCLGASFNKKSIPCEEMPWDKSLDVIVEFIQNELENKK